MRIWQQPNCSPFMTVTEAVHARIPEARSAKDEAEGEAIRQALEQTNWNRKQAAGLLQISYKALLYKIRQYGIAEGKGHHKLSAGA